jgi:hypothetical protein
MLAVIALTGEPAAPTASPDERCTAVEKVSTVTACEP